MNYMFPIILLLGVSMAMATPTVVPSGDSKEGQTKDVLRTQAPSNISESSTGSPNTQIPCNTNETPLGKVGKDCTRQWKPVCGSDGQTYGNQCEFENAQIAQPSLTMTRAGTCDKQNM